MKTLYLRLLKDYKKEMIFIVTFFTFFGVGIQYYTQVLSMDVLIPLGVSYLFCLFVLLNGSLVFTPSIDENSNAFEVFSRWGTIVLAVFLLLYLIVEPVFKR